jgi:hypothetical protein
LRSALLFFVSLLTLVLTASVGGSDREAPLSSQQAARQASLGRLDRETGITAPDDVLEALNKIRAALGGRAALMRVSSLSCKGTSTYDRTVLSFERLVRVPDSLKETRDGIVYCLAGRSYWQTPQPASGEGALRAMKRTLEEQCLVWLLRGVGEGGLTARWASDVKDRAIVFEGAGGFSRTLEFDAATHRLTAFSLVGTVTQGQAVSQGIRRVSIDAYQRVRDVWLPRRLTLRQEGFPVMVDEFNNVLLNAGVGIEDFERR